MGYILGMVGGMKKILSLRGLWQWVKRGFTGTFYEIERLPDEVGALEPKPEPEKPKLNETVKRDLAFIAQGSYQNTPKVRRFYISISFDIPGQINRFWDPHETEFVNPLTMGLAPGDLIPETFQIAQGEIKVHQACAENWVTKNLPRNLRRKVRFHLHDVKEKG